MGAAVCDAKIEGALRRVKVLSVRTEVRLHVAYKIVEGVVKLRLPRPAST